MSHRRISPSAAQEFWGWSVWGFKANRASSYAGRRESPFFSLSEVSLLDPCATLLNLGGDVTLPSKQGSLNVAVQLVSSLLWKEVLPGSHWKIIWYPRPPPILVLK